MIELLVVMLVIVILAGIVFKAGRALQERGKIEQAKADIARLSMAVERYYADHGRYPRGGNVAWGNTRIFSDDFEVELQWGETAAGAAHLWAYLDEDCTYRRDRRSYISGWPKDRLGIQPTYAGPQGFVLRYYKDPWGNPYGYRTDHTKRLEDRDVYILLSGGPNGSIGQTPDADDIGTHTEGR